MPRAYTGLRYAVLNQHGKNLNLSLDFLHPSLSTFRNRRQRPPAITSRIHAIRTDACDARGIRWADGAGKLGNQGKRPFRYHLPHLLMVKTPIFARFYRLSAVCKR